MSYETMYSRWIDISFNYYTETAIQILTTL